MFVDFDAKYFTSGSHAIYSKVLHVQVDVKACNHFKGHNSSILNSVNVGMSRVTVSVSLVADQVGDYICGCRFFFLCGEKLVSRGLYNFLKHQCFLLYL